MPCPSVCAGGVGGLRVFLCAVVRKSWLVLGLARGCREFDTERWLLLGAWGKWFWKQARSLIVAWRRVRSTKQLGPLASDMLFVSREVEHPW